MAQKLRTAGVITDGDFDRLTEFILREDKDLLKMLAKV